MSAEALQKNQKTKRFMHLFFKIFIIFMLSTAALNILIFAWIYFNDKNESKKEAVYLTPPGQMVEINGHNMHVLVGGNVESEETLVFMHSATTYDDAIALQPLWDKLSDYKLVLVERSGYGYSEVSESEVSRDIDIILSETRQAIEKCGISGEYTLVPIGTAGVEAIYWAKEYPEEIKGIFGISINYPEQFASITQDEYCGFFDYLLVKFCDIGGQRIMKTVYPNNDYALYTPLQMNIRNALISNNGYTRDMYNEDLAMVDNAAKVAKEGWPEDVNIFVLYANPLMEPYRKTNEDADKQYQQAMEINPNNDYIALYNEELFDYYAQHKNVTIEEIDGPVRIYTYNPQQIAEKIVNFLYTE